MAKFKTGKIIQLIGGFFAAALLASFFIWLGGTAAKREKGEGPAYEKLVREIIDLPTTTRNFLQRPELYEPGAELQKIKHEEPPHPYTPITEEGIKPLGIDKFLFVNYYDFEEEQYQFNLINLNNGRIVKEVEIPYKKLQGIFSSDSIFEKAKQQEKKVMKCALMHPLLTKKHILFPFPLTPGGEGPFCVYDLQSEQIAVKKSRAHHSKEIGPKGNLYLLGSGQQQYSAREKDAWGERNAAHAYDAKFHVTPFRIYDYQSGKQVQFISFDSALVSNPEWDFRSINRVDTWDYHHGNDAQPVYSDGPYWQKGDAFISLRSPSMVLQLRPSTGEVVWAKMLPWKKQHDVNIVNDSIITVFSNGTVQTTEAKQFVPGSYSQLYFYDFSKDSAYVLPEIQQLIKKYDICSPTEGRAKFFPQDSVVFIESTEQAKILVADLKQDQSFVLAVPATHQEGKLVHIRWSRIYDRNPLVHGPIQ